MTTFTFILLPVFILNLSVHYTFGEFRFCYYGPHKFTFNDCPGGVLFQKPIPTTCAYLAKTSRMGDGRATAIADVCDGTHNEDADLTSDMTSHSFALDTLQEITFDGELLPPNETAVDEPISQCACLGEWKDPTTLRAEIGAVIDDDIEPIYTYPKLDEETQKQQQKLTEQLFMNLILNEGGDDKPPTSLRVGKMLEASFLIMTTYCPMPYISQTFVRKTIDAFFFFASNGNKSVRDIGQREFDEVMDVLAQCRYFDTWDNFQIIPKDCAETPTILGGISYGLDGEVKKVVLRLNAPVDSLDPFIEASWQAVSFISAQCFRYDTPQFNLHHIYEVAMEALFTEYILLRWANPPKLPNPNFWNNLLGTRNFETEIQNVNSCARLAYVMNPYKKRLERPFTKVNGTESADARSTEGWTGSEDEYWQNYQAKGGFKAIVEMLSGKCYSSEGERENDKSATTDHCSDEENHETVTTPEAEPAEK